MSHRVRPLTLRGVIAVDSGGKAGAHLDFPSAAVFLGSPPPLGYGYSEYATAAGYATPIVAVILGELCGRYLNDWVRLPFRELLFALPTDLTEFAFSSRTASSSATLASSSPRCVCGRATSPSRSSSSDSAVSGTTRFRCLSCADFSKPLSPRRFVREEAQHCGRHLWLGTCRVCVSFASPSDIQHLLLAPTSVAILINTVAVYAYLNNCFPTRQGEVSALINLARTLGGFACVLSPNDSLFEEVQLPT